MLNKRFVELYTQVGENIRDTSTGTQSVIKRMVNEAYDEMLKRFNFDVTDDDYTVSTVSGTKDYALQHNFGKELYVLDTTNNIYLKRMDMQEYAQENPSLVNTSGTVEAYAILNQPAKAQPSAASVLAFSSSSAVDNASSAYVKGIDANGNELSETISLNGTSAVNSANTYTSIVSLSKDSTTGSITVTSNSAAVTNAIMAPTILDYKVKILRLFQTPTGTLVLAVPFIMTAMPLVNDGDTMVIEGADFVLARATAKAWTYRRQFSKAQEFNKEAERLLAENLWNQDNNPNQEHRFGIVAYTRDTA